jgi:hypothetical protein
MDVGTDPPRSLEVRLLVQLLAVKDDVITGRDKAIFLADKIMDKMMEPNDRCKERNDS